MVSYIKVHIILSAKYGKVNLLQYFWNVLQSEKTKMGISLNDIYDIIHNKDPNEFLETSCLDYANQNNDEITAELVLKFENIVHMQDRLSLYQCIRESLKNDEMKMWIKEQIEEKEDEGCISECKRKIGSIFSQCKMKIGAIFSLCIMIIGAIFAQCKMKIRSFFFQCMVKIRAFFSQCKMKIEAFFSHCKIKIEKLFSQCEKKIRAIFSQCKKNIETILEENKRHIAAILSVLIQLVFLSILPYSMDEVSDIRLYLTYSAKSNENQTSQEFTTDHAMHNEYTIAKKITGLILLINGLIYVSGIIFSKPSWITRHIKEITKKETRIKELKNAKKGGFILLESNQKELDKLLRDPPSKQWKVFLKFSSVLARMFWPLLILIPNNYLIKTTTVKSDKSKDKYKSENIWMFLKVVESSIENVTQLFLQIWLLLPDFKIISMWSWYELMMAALNGSLNILSFGYYQPKELNMPIGKIFTTIILLSLLHAMQRIKKPGNGIGETMKLLLIMFPATLLQVIARMYMVRNLMLMNISGAVKYSLFIVIHCLALLIMKILFETRRKQKVKIISKQYTVQSIQSNLKGFKALLRFKCLQNILNGLIKKSIPTLNGVIKASSSIFYRCKRPTLLIASCLSSTIVMVDLHWMSSRLHYPKFNFITTSLFHLLILLENLAMTLLPFLAPSLFPSSSDFNHDSFVQAVLIVTISWIFAVMLEVRSLLS